MSRQLMLRLWRTRSLPTLTQGSTLTIRSNIPDANVSIRSEWRDDGHVSLYRPLKLNKQQQHRDANPQTSHRNVNMVITQEDDRSTSLSGRSEPHLSIQLEEDNDNAEGTNTGETSLHEYMTEAEAVSSSSDTLLSITVPEKINIDCSLQQGGSISIHNKVEGDVRLLTTDGSVHVHKIRGHAIDIEAAVPSDGGEGGMEMGKRATIYSSDLLEASTLTLKIPSPSLGRVRAKRIHAKTVNIAIGKHCSDPGTSTGIGEEMVSMSSSSTGRHPSFKLDEDDSGALCDISSLYLSGHAEIEVESNTPNNEGRVVRIKSNHGPVVIKATAPKPLTVDDMTGRIVPLVDLGGVNGSCEVFVKAREENATDKQEVVEDDTDMDWTSCQVHFDSISPDTVSLVQVGQGDVGITLDRKVEADMRLLSASNAESLDMEVLLADDAEGDDDDDEEDDNLILALSELDESSTKNTGKQGISIRTKAFTERKRLSKPDQVISSTSKHWKNIEYIDGWVENKSGEPDSRFDRKLRGDNPSDGGGGKIRLEGAAAQALQGFQRLPSSPSSSTKNDPTHGESVTETFQRPLLAVAAKGKIAVETLSWLGNIARRFGMDETRESDDLGRTATRRGRDLAPGKE